MCRWRNNEPGKIARDFNIIVNFIKTYVYISRDVQNLASFICIFFQLHFYILRNLPRKFFEENFCEKFASKFFIRIVCILLCNYWIILSKDILESRFSQFRLRNSTLWASNIPGTEHVLIQNATQSSCSTYPRGYTKACDLNKINARILWRDVPWI